MLRVACSAVCALCSARTVYRLAGVVPGVGFCLEGLLYSRMLLYVQVAWVVLHIISCAACSSDAYAKGNIVLLHCA
jgi:hypothetical protein